MQEITRACSYAYRHATDVPKTGVKLALERDVAKNVVMPSPESLYTPERETPYVRALVRVIPECGHAYHCHVGRRAEARRTARMTRELALDAFDV